MKLALSTLLTALVLSACAGIHARNDVLMPAMVIALEGIKPDIVSGADAAALSELADLEAALKSGNIQAALNANWHLLYGIAVKSLDDRLAAQEIGITVHRILRQRLEAFNESYLKLRQL